MFTTQSLCNRIRRVNRFTPCERIRCADGFSISVQAGDGIYSNPRKDGMDSYTEVELGFPSEAIPEFLDYRDGGVEDTENVFGYVPIQMVVDLLNSHGGEFVEPDHDANQDALYPREFLECEPHGQDTGD